ncbi:MAG: methyl-accepting chemotaxis protein [Nitrospirae bacterium]|nr:methyl-accepting chemotaxis protein [Nitrospirota bacterium]
MTIRNRIIYSSAILFALFMTMVLVNWFGNKSVTKKTDLAYLLENETMHLQGLFRGINEFIIDEGEPLSRQLTQEHLKGFEDLHDELMAKFDDPELRKTLDEKIAPQWKKVKDGVDSFLKIKLIKVTNDDAMLQYGQLTTEAKTLLKEVDALAAKSLEDAKSTAKKVELIINIGATAIIILMCLILLTLYRTIISPIKELNTIAEGFEKGDLSIVMDESKKDEFGKLAFTFNHALSRLSEFVSKLRNVINTVASNAEAFAADTARIASDSQSQSSQTTSSVAAIEELSATFSDIGQNTENVSSFSREAFELAMQSKDVVLDAMDRMNIIANAVKDAAKTVESLSHRSKQIGEIIKVIDEIADQTNLLALNANIEAARAGEQGRGFSVVANEVRKLAESTTAATNEIADMIKGIQDDTCRAVSSMHACTKEVESGAGLAGKAGSSLQMIVVSSQNVSDMIQRIAAAVDEQSAAASEITANLSAIANISRQTNDSAQKASDAGTELRQMASEMQALAKEFKLKNGVSDYTKGDHQPLSADIKADGPCYSLRRGAPRPT